MSIDIRAWRSAWPLVAIEAAIAASFLPVAAGYVKRYSVPLSSALGIYCCFLIFLTCLIAPATQAGRALLGRLIGVRYRAITILALLAFPYFIYAGGTADFHWLALARLIAIATPVVVTYSAIPVRDQAKFNWQDALAAIWLIAVVLLHLFAGIWSVPTNLDFMARLFMVSLGALCWTYIRPVPGMGYCVELNRKVFASAAGNFVFFASIAIPLGLLLGFTAWNPRWRGLPDFLTAYLQILLFIAVLEELFFRGFLQNLFEKSLGSWWLGQLIASCMFGLFHILHAPFPNWRYVVLASIAGWFYGSAYRSGGTLFSSALLHAMVDTLWRTFFTRG